MRQAVRRRNQARDLLAAQDLGQAPGRLRVRRVFEQIPAPQRLVEEEADRADVQLDGPRCQLPLTEQIRLVGAEMGWVQAVGRAFEVAGELLDVLDVVRDRRCGVVATVELVQHRLALMGHKAPPPVTLTLPGRSSKPYA